MGDVRVQIPTSIWRDPEFTSLTWQEQYEWFAVVFERARKKRPWISSEIRQRVYDRDGNRCLACGTSDDLTLDHKHPYSLGGSDDESNLQTLCRPCNSKKGARV